MSLSRRQLLRSLVATPVAAVLASVAASKGKPSWEHIGKISFKLNGAVWKPVNVPTGMEVIDTAHISPKEASRLLGRVLATLNDREQDVAAINAMVNEGGPDFSGAY